MTFDSLMHRVKAMIVLEYLAPRWCLGLCFKNIIRTVDLIMAFGNQLHLIRTVGCVVGDDLDCCFALLMKSCM